MENNKPKILIVDDEKGLRVGTARLLESEGYHVFTAENGEQGIEMGTTNEYDLAVIDLKMPDVGGLDVLKSIKASRPNTVCFIATAYASYDTAIEATRLGAYTYIPKPFTPDELLHQLQQGMRQRKLLLEAALLKKEREENLLEIAHEKSRLNTIIESISSGVLLVNKSGELVYYNKATLRKLSIDGLNIGEYVLDKLPSKISEIVKVFLESDEERKNSVTTQLETIPNGQMYVDATCSPVPHPDGSFAGVVIVLKNITEFKRIELIKSQFVSMVAHELKTPVSAVLGFLRIILDDSIDVSYEQQQKYLSRSAVRLQGLLDLVNDLLDISRMELKTKQRELQELDLKEIIDSTVQFLEFELDKKGLSVSVDIEENLPKLTADHGEITRLFTNLLSNAIKYNKDNGQIFIKIRRKKDFIVSDVADTGIGLKPEEKDRLFHEFFRAKNKNTRGVSGTGLGLSIVKRIVEAYHGKIEVESVYEQGTTFSIHLPINK